MSETAAIRPSETPAPQPDLQALYLRRFNPETEKKIQEQCLKGNHSLRLILSGGAEQDGWQVVWCSWCGAVAVDGTCDGRVAPGSVLSMHKPANMNWE